VNMHEPTRPAAGACSAQVSTWREGRPGTQPDWLADEVPVALVFNGISFAVMLASPLDLEDFALGFALSEGLLGKPSQLYGVDVLPTEQGIEVHLQVASACEQALKERRRNLSGRTGCGLCGTESLQQVLRPLPQLAGTLHIRPPAVAQALQTLRLGQALQHSTGATHAAAWCSPQGKALLVREDVGRHNALDKLIGALHRQGFDANEGFVTITSRASVEMVQKCAMAGISLMVAVSAPTALAVQVAAQAGLALAGFARGDHFVAYHQPERFGLPALPLP